MHAQTLGSVWADSERSMTAAAMPRTARHFAIFLPALSGGGAERAMVNLAGGMAARGVRVDLVRNVGLPRELVRVIHNPVEIGRASCRERV